VKVHEEIYRDIKRDDIKRDHFGRRLDHKYDYRIEEYYLEGDSQESSDEEYYEESEGEEKRNNEALSQVIPYLAS
jgi:hypothetical protein